MQIHLCLIFCVCWGQEIIECLMTDTPQCDFVETCTIHNSKKLKKTRKVCILSPIKLGVIGRPAHRCLPLNSKKKDQVKIHGLWYINFELSIQFSRSSIDVSVILRTVQINLNIELRIFE